MADAIATTSALPPSGLPGHPAADRARTPAARTTGPPAQSRRRARVATDTGDGTADRGQEA